MNMLYLHPAGDTKAVAGLFTIPATYAVAR